VEHDAADERMKSAYKMLASMLNLAMW